MAYWWRAPSFLPDDPSLISSSHDGLLTTTCNCTSRAFEARFLTLLGNCTIMVSHKFVILVSGASDALSDFLRHQTHMWYTNMHADKKSMHIKIHKILTNQKYYNVLWLHVSINWLCSFFINPRPVKTF